MVGQLPLRNCPGICPGVAKLSARVPASYGTAELSQRLSQRFGIFYSTRNPTLIAAFSVAHHTLGLWPSNIRATLKIASRRSKCQCAHTEYNINQQVTYRRGSAKDIRWHGRRRRDSLNALEAGDAVRSSVLSLISSAPAKNELSHYASTAQLYECGRDVVSVSTSRPRDGLET